MTQFAFCFLILLCVLREYLIWCASLLSLKSFRDPTDNHVYGTTGTFSSFIYAVDYLTMYANIFSQDWNYSISYSHAGWWPKNGNFTIWVRNCIQRKGQGGIEMTHSNFLGAQWLDSRQLIHVRVFIYSIAREFFRVSLSHLEQGLESRVPTWSATVNWRARFCEHLDFFFIQRFTYFDF